MEEKILIEHKKTPFKRLVAALIIGELGLYISLLTPVMLLLTFKIMDIDPLHAAASFGMVSGVGALFALSANPVGGAISDRTCLNFGRRRTWILIGSVLGSISLIGILLSTKVWMVVVFWCCVQLFFNFAMASYTALVPDQVDESLRGSISGILGLVAPIGPILGMVIMTIMGKAPLTAKWGVLVAIGIISAIISCMMIKEGKVEYKQPENERVKLSFGEALSKIYPSPRKYPAFTWGWLTRFFVALAYCSSSYNAMMLMQRYHLSQQQTTGMTTLISIVGMAFLAVSSLFGGVLSDKYRKQKPFVLSSAIVVGIGLVINAFAPTVTYIIIGYAVSSFGYGIYLAVDMALVARILPNKGDAAKDFGIMNIANTIPQSIVPFIGPILLGIGGWTFFFGALAVNGLLSAIAVIPIPEMSPKPVQEVVER